MKILAIETSCDDTGIAVLEVKNKKFAVKSNIVSSQEIHQNYGGVFPMMAKREHQKNLVPVLTQALKEAKLLQSTDASFDEEVVKNILEKEQELVTPLIEFLKKHQKPKVDAIAVTNGPGLEPCLWVGVNFARVLSYVWGIPLIPVNHIEAHILVNYLKNKTINFPAIALVVSGGHTQLVLAKGIGKYKIIGETRDDAAGECFDKCAKLLGLGYPGGPVISNIASGVKKSMVTLPRPMMSSKDYDFSFSGLKTAVLYTIRDHQLTDEFVKSMSFEVQQSIIDVLLKKTLAAAKEYKVKTIILGGGVSANRELRRQLKVRVTKELPKVKCLIPDANLSTDNGLMIAVAAGISRAKKIGWEHLSASANLRIDSHTLKTRS